MTIGLPVMRERLIWSTIPWAVRPTAQEAQWSGREEAGRAEDADGALDPTLGATAGCHDLQRMAEVCLDTHFHRRNFHPLRSE
ncbi:MAG: hypothetical protein RBU30_23725, partial [Polyangia bacterium]|nr:hypothetical protein [Polyangia bacterium]